MLIAPMMTFVKNTTSILPSCRCTFACRAGEAPAPYPHNGRPHWLPTPSPPPLAAPRGAAFRDQPRRPYAPATAPRASHLTVMPAP
jgi:hypothetical protein